MKSKFYIVLGVVLAGWFSSCQNTSPNENSYSNSTIFEQKIAINNDSLINLGQSIAKKTFQTLSSHLKKQIETGGVDSAISYCNVNAIPLTNSLSNRHNVSIKRVAKKYRNQANALSDEEASIFEKYKNNELQGATIQMNNEGKQVFYSPIKLQPLCVICHGTKEQIGENYTLISQLYPDDKAIGFVPDELRGMWSITFN